MHADCLHIYLAGHVYRLTGGILFISSMHVDGVGGDGCSHLTCANVWLQADYEERQASQAGKFHFNPNVKLAGSQIQTPGARKQKDGLFSEGRGLSVPNRRAQAGDVCKGPVHSAKRKLVSFEGEDGDEDDADN
jgi:hypothetical protein